MKRDVQRNFVLLRQLYSGRESGYARAETRDGKVNLNLVVQGFAAEVSPCAFAVTDEGLLFIGPLNMDARGQGGIAAQLNSSDFRHIQVLFVSYLDGKSVMIPLAGTVGRNGWVDWTKVSEAVRELMEPQQEEQPQPAPKQEAPSGQGESAAQAPAENSAESAPQTPAGDAAADKEEMEEKPAPEAEADETPRETAPETPAEVAPEQADTDRIEESAPEKPPVQAPQEAREEAQEPERSEVCTPQEDVPQAPQEAAPRAAEEKAAAQENAQGKGEEAGPDLFDLPAQEDPFEVVERSLRTPLPREQKLELPQKLRNAYWPQVLWPLHDLFERFAQVQPFGEAESDTVYIRVPLGDALREIDHYLIGAKVEGDWVVGVGYLIPGAFSESAPSGMSGYEWKDGYWQSWQYVETE